MTEVVKILIDNTTIKNYGDSEITVNYGEITVKLP